MITCTELPIIFPCQTDELLGIIHQPTDFVGQLGVLIAVGGPQYRVGSHRQFVLLARYLASQNIPVMRFDYRGMGDSSGEMRSFSNVDADIDAAVNCFDSHCPGLAGIVIWGLCDAASAALFYSYQNQRIKGLVLLNPWVFTEQGAAKTYLKHYYWQRLTSPDLWRKVFRLQFNYRQSLQALIYLIKKRLQPVNSDTDHLKSGAKSLVSAELSLPVRMKVCWQRFEYPILLLLSGRDLTADEFRELIKSDSEWQPLITADRVTTKTFAEADHTFSSVKWRQCVEETTLSWLKELKENL